MGAGAQRWWRPTFAEECAKHDASREIADDILDHGPVRCVDEDGIEFTARLYTRRPMWYGTFKIS
jgi:hypothetical protein